MPQKKIQESKLEEKIPARPASAKRAKTAAPASSVTNGEGTAVAKAKAAASKPAASKPAASKSRKSTNGSATDALLKLNGAVNGYASAAQIAEKAYFLWLEKGCPEGSADQDWVEAERLLAAH